MSRENLKFLVEGLASLDPDDIESDKVDILFETEIGDTSVEISIVKTAQKMLEYLNEGR